jgi:putative glutamine amidotransferase
MKPRIGITCGTGSPKWARGGDYWQPYADAVAAAGGEPVHLGPKCRGRERAVLGDLQGILFSGGKDVDLTMYPNPPDLEGESPEAVMARYRMQPEAKRDVFELPLLHEALSMDMPVLGICRGCQLLNVGLGGRLVLDVPMETESPIEHRAAPPPVGASRRHSLRIAPGTLLASILDPDTFIECNSRHHQAVRIDESLRARISALSPEDGVVEAIEVPGRRWALGVQWHPEYRTDPDIQERYRPLFEAFIGAA